MEKKSSSAASAGSATGNAAVRILSAYGPKLRVSISFPEQGKTHQSFKEECDVNNIMARFTRTGVVDWVNKREARYGDASSADFQQSMLIVAEAKSRFAGLPAALRARFRNDPGEFLAFAEDPENRAEAIKMGIFKPEVAPVEPEGSAGTPPQGRGGKAAYARS